MAENGNRGPNDFRARNGRRRREPPIIDASATEVPLASDEPVAAEAPEAARLRAAASDVPETATSAEVAGDVPSTPDTSEPVLFGSAKRDPVAKPEGGTSSDAEAPVGDAAELAAATPDGDIAAQETATAPETPTETPRPAPAAEEPTATPAPASSLRPGATIPPYPGREAARASGGAATWLLALSSLVLLAALAWVLYTEPQRSGRNEVADLRNRIAALEARPDPSQVEGRLAALDKRVGDADTDRAALARTVTDLTPRLDAVAQQAQSAQQAAETDAAKPAAQPAPTGAAAVATAGALAALAAELESRVTALSTAQDQTAKAVADLPKPVAPDFGPVDAKVAALDGHLAALDGKVNGSDARLNAFDAKVNGVDGKINGSDARMNAFENRTNGLSSKVDDTAGGLGRLQETVADLPRVDLAPLQAATASLDGEVGKIDGRIAGIEAQLAPAKDGARVTEVRAVGSADEARATPIALVGQAVGRALAEGRPYASDLETLKALGADPEAVAKLTPLAAKGAPTAATLKDRWDAVEGDVLAAVKPAEGGSALERFAAGARSLVQVRRVGAVQGEDPAALVSQIDAALGSGDVPGALATWSRLPPAGQDRSQDWAAAARGRIDAANAAQGLVGRAIATLGRTKS